MNKIEYIIEVAPGGPWLAQDGSVAIEFKDRGIWCSPEDAQLAAEASLRPWVGVAGIREREGGHEIKTR